MYVCLLGKLATQSVSQSVSPMPPEAPLQEPVRCHSLNAKSPTEATVPQTIYVHTSTQATPMRCAEGLAAAADPKPKSRRPPAGDPAHPGKSWNPSSAGSRMENSVLSVAATHMRCNGLCRRQGMQAGSVPCVSTSTPTLAVSPDSVCNCRDAPLGNNCTWYNGAPPPSSGWNSKRPLCRHRISSGVDPR